MTLSAGNASATSGMARAIYEQIDAVLSPDLPPDPPPELREAWKKLSFAIASGVTSYLRRDAGDTEYAEVDSTGADDPTYWAWLDGFVQCFTRWAPTQADSVALRNVLNTYLTTHPVPTRLRGSLR